MLEIGCAWSKGSGERLQGHHGPLVSHVSAEVRGENTKKSRLNLGSNSQPRGHKSNTLTTEPPGRG